MWLRLIIPSTFHSPYTRIVSSNHCPGAHATVPSHQGRNFAWLYFVARGQIPGRRWFPFEAALLLVPKYEIQPHPTPPPWQALKSVSKRGLQGYLFGHDSQLEDGQGGAGGFDGVSRAWQLSGSTKYNQDLDKLELAGDQELQRMINWQSFEEPTLPTNIRSGRCDFVFDQNLVHATARRRATA